MFFSLNFDGGRVFNFRIYSSFRSITNPLSNENLISFSEKIWSLSLSLIIDPMAFEMVPTPFGHDAIATSLAHKPHSLIDITIGVDHSALAMRLTIHPHTIISISTLEEHGSSSLFEIIFPVPGVFPPEFIFGITDPECSLAMSFIIFPSSFVFVSIFIMLDTEPIFFVILPISNIFVGAYPFVRFFGPIFVQGLFLNRS